MRDLHRSSFAMQSLLFAYLMGVLFMPSNADRNRSETANDSGGALSEFSMMLRSVGAKTYRDENVVVRNGLISKEWSSNCKNDEANCKQKLLSIYTDVVVFEFSYSNPHLFRFQVPTVKTTGGRARPRIQDFATDVDEKSGEIVVSHDCIPTGDKETATSVVKLTLLLTDSISMDFVWHKTCGFGDHETLDIGFLDPRGDEASTKVSMRGLNNVADSAVFGPTVLSTRVYMSLLKDEHSQHFLTPTVRASEFKVKRGKLGKPERLGVEIKGGTFGGVIMGRAPSVFDIFYSCHGRGIWKVQVGIKLRPFNALLVEWLKDCGGGKDGRIHVGTKSGVADVVLHGETTNSFSSGVSEKNKEIVSGKGGGTKAFFLWVEKINNTIGSIEIGAISAHSSNERVGTARIPAVEEVYEKVSGGVKPLAENGEVLEGPTERLVAVEVKCFRKGKVKVGVTMTIRDRDPLEWWFFNDCIKPGGTRKNRFFLTAERLMCILLSVFGVIAIIFMRAGYSRRPKRSDGRRGYRRVEQ